MKWVTTNPSLGAGKSSPAIGAPPHRLIAPAGGHRRSRRRGLGRYWLASVGRAHRVDRDADQNELLVLHGAAIVILVVIFFSYAQVVVYLFFFSSRRRHTRLVSDWSSEVCSSDLSPRGQPGAARRGLRRGRPRLRPPGGGR